MVSVFPGNTVGNPFWSSCNGHKLLSGLSGLILKESAGTNGTLRAALPVRQDTQRELTPVNALKGKQSRLWRITGAGAKGQKPGLLGT